jgi:hypothetical protein
MYIMHVRPMENNLKNISVDQENVIAYLELRQILNMNITTELIMMGNINIQVHQSHAENTGNHVKPKP